MANFVFPQGTTATWQKWTTSAIPWVLAGSPATFNGLRSIGATTKTRTVADITTLQDTTIRRAPAKKDLGTLQLTLNLLDDVSASNEKVALETAWTNGDYIQIVVNLPGTFDDSGDNQRKVSGFISSIGSPEVAVSDEPLSYTVDFTLVEPKLS